MSSIARIRIAWLASAVLLACSGSAERADTIASSEGATGSGGQAAQSCTWSSVKTAAYASGDYDLGGFCLPGSLSLDDDGRAPCVVFDFEAPLDGACSCDPARGRAPVEAAHAPALARALEELKPLGAAPDCPCEFLQADGADLVSCETPNHALGKMKAAGFNGYCYQDSSVDPPIGDTGVTDPCPSSVLLAFVGDPVISGTGAFVMLCGSPECTIAGP